MRTHPSIAALVAAAGLAACTGHVGSGKDGGDGGGPSGDGGGDGGACEGAAAPVVPRLRRLTFAQYDRTIADLVGLELAPSSQLGPEVDGMTPVLYAGLRAAAEDVATRTVADPAAFARLVPCAAAADEACARTFVTTFGRRAFRRSLTDAEIEAYVALFRDRAELTESGSFPEGIALVLEAFLQSPDLLVRIERSAVADGSRIALSGPEVATRLSYALWNAPPDDALLAAAERGDLDTAAGVRAEAQRMLAGDGLARARSLVRSAHADYLGMVGAYAQFWSNTNRDPALFPDFYEGIDADFREEMLRTVDHVVFEQRGGFDDLFTTETVVMNAGLAPIYGQDPAQFPDWKAVEVADGTRVGMLSRAGFLGTHGRFTRGSLIYRGAFVLKRVLCRSTGSPPAGADATPLPDSNEELRTTRERIEAMTAGDDCAICHHAQINPAGFAFESYDGVGAYRTEENGVPVDTTGTITLDGTAQAYADAAAYARLLGASREAQACYVERFGAFTFGDAAVELGCSGEALAAKLGEPGVSLQDFLVEFVSSGIL